MATAFQKITLSSSRDIPFNKLVLSQANVRRVKAGVSVEELAESIARCGLIQSLHVRPVLDAEGAETGMFEVPAGDAFELMRDQAADHFERQTRSSWKPRSGSMVNHRNLTSAMIDSRDFLAAKRRAETEVLLPAGAKIAFSGGDTADHQLIWAKLDQIHAKHADMVLLHGGSPKGAEKIASRWADTRKVPQVAFKPDWTRHTKAAPFKRNDQMLAIMPIGVIIFPGTGIQDNLADKARKLGIPVYRFGSGGA